MSTVPALLKQRWRSGNLVGDAAHHCLVRIRQGWVNHFYEPPTMLSTSPDQDVVFPTIWKGHNVYPWQGQWGVTGPWIELPNIQSANFTRDLSNNGGSVLTVVMDNIAFNQATGTAGIYHTIDRGWFSPTRGVKVNSRPSLWAENEWGDVFNGGYQIELWEGYGTGSDVQPVWDSATNRWSAPAAARTWVGWLDEIEMTSHPDQVTLTCRDGSILLTDQRLMGQNKAAEILSPVTFASRTRTLGETRQFARPVASDGSVTSTDPRTGVAWASQAYSDPGHTPWVDVHLPAGFYEDFYAAFLYGGPTLYVSLHANAGSTMDNGTVDLPAGWVDLGLGSVPDSGIPYILRHANIVGADVPGASRRWSLGGHTFQLADDSVLRLSFGNLALNPDTGAYQAGVTSLYAFRYGTNPAALDSGASGGMKATGWVLVDDAADVVRMILLWAGFQEFHVENFGWTLEAPMSFGQDAFFIDVINQILAQGNYLFFIDAPTDHDMSLGVPKFVSQSATNPTAPGGMLQVQDTQLVEALAVKWDRSNLPYVMRYIGAQIEDAKAVTTGVLAGLGLVQSYVGTYWPPWSGHDYTNLQGRHFKGGYDLERLGGVRRQWAETNTGLKSVAECLFACILAAIQFALQAVTGQFQMPGLPGVTLNQQVSVVDQGTGTSSRLWVASVDSQHTLGPDGTWHMTVGGSLLDTEDMDLITQDYLYTYARYVVARGPA